MPITHDDMLRSLYKNRVKKHFMHKTRYGKTLGEKWSYDRKEHANDYMAKRDKPMSPLWDRM